MSNIAHNQDRRRRPVLVKWRNNPCCLFALSGGLFFACISTRLLISAAFSLCPLNRKESHHDAIIAIGWRHHVRLLPDRIRIIQTLSPPYPCGSQTTGGVMPDVNHSALRAAQSKAVIARFLGDAGMWLQANQQMKQAVSMPWYRRPQ